MAAPVILAVDEDPDALRDIDQELNDRYAAMAGRHIYIRGGANSARQAALYLARYAAHVTVVVRADSLSAGMSHHLIHEIEGTPSRASGSGEWQPGNRGRERTLPHDRRPPAHRVAAA